MRSLGVVEGEVAVEALHDGGHRVVGVQIDLFVFQGAPEPLDEDIVAPAALAVHAELNAVGLGHVGEVAAGKLRGLICVQDRGPAVALERLLEGRDAEGAVERD